MTGPKPFACSALNATGHFRMILLTGQGDGGNYKSV